MWPGATRQQTMSSEIPNRDEAVVRLPLTEEQLENIVAPRFFNDHAPCVVQSDGSQPLNVKGMFGKVLPTSKYDGALAHLLGSTQKRN